MAKGAKREAILDAATVLFTRYGVRGTTMEAIAKEANVAKATAYSYFPDKDRVFIAVCERVAEMVLARTKEALLATKGTTTTTVKARITAALIAKFGLVFDLAYGSPHAKELVDSTDKHAQKLFEETDAEYTRMLATALAKARLPGKASAARVAKLLFSSADGIASNATSSRELQEQLGALVDWVLP